MVTLLQAVVFSIQRFSVQDGPGIRTTVFFKSCPLRCLWCANPESHEGYIQVAHSDMACRKCGDCLPVCPRHAILMTGDGIQIDRARCDNCAKCVEACVYGAIKSYGQHMTVGQVMEVVKRDLSFYKESKGGVTASGGEPLMQAEFVRELFKECKAAAIHTCLDTSGYGSASALTQILEYTDLVLYDLKLVDATRHQAATGQSNEVILRNLYTVTEQRIPLVIRVPLVPGFNCSEEDIEAIARLVSALTNDSRRIEVDLLPYHRYGANKYVMLDIDYKLAELQTIKPNDPAVRQAQEIIERFDLKCRVVA
jgi:pyruvate formate lyase activating enzyme